MKVIVEPNSDPCESQEYASEGMTELCMWNDKLDIQIMEGISVTAHGVRQNLQWRGNSCGKCCLKSHMKSDNPDDKNSMFPVQIDHSMGKLSHHKHWWHEEHHNF